MIPRKAIIVSAPSGSGKTTIVRYLLDQIPSLQFSISATSREKRFNEQHGRDYYFLTAGQFKKKIMEGAFLEWEEVYKGVFYGTLKSEIERIWQAGRHVIFDVDVKGGIALKKYFKEKGLALFIAVNDIAVLKSRLIKRKTETVSDLDKRLAKAAYEMSFQGEFDKVILNDVLTDSNRQAKETVLDFLNG